jgi:cytochrome P450 family 6
MFLFIVALLLIAVCWFIKNQYSYWENLGIASIKPEIPFGNIKSVLNKQRSFGTALFDLYRQSTEPFVGIYLFFRPALLIRDAELIKSILKTDFQHFHAHGVYCDPKNDPMSANLFGLTGEPWKELHGKLTPAFTPSKLKSMFPTIKAVGDGLVELMQPIAKHNKVVEIRDHIGRYTLDCIATIAFGLDDVSTLKNPDHEFRTIGRKLQDNSKFMNIIRGAGVFLCPKYFIKCLHC